MNSENVSVPGSLGLKVNEAAAQAGVHPNTVRDWIKAGKLRARRMHNGQLRIQPDDIQRLVTDVVQP